MWYENSFRRHLLDMHIEDWDDLFLSKFSPKEYYDNLKRGNIKSAMLYFQSHVGYCYYPTKTGHMHSAFQGQKDKMRQLTQLCREGGIDVIGYYSLIYNNWAHDNYPEWRTLDQEGKSHRENGGRYGLCCPNNFKYREFVFSQIKEMADYFEFDGMFYDMLFWPGICYCDSCKKRWSEEVGGDLPVKTDWNDNNWNLFMKKRQEWMGEFAQIATDETKRLKPHVSVEHNFASGVLSNWVLGATELVNDACDYTGGDLYGGILEQSFTCKFYKNITKNQPFEYMFCRCNPKLTKHTITKPDKEMLLSVMLTLAHHGATLVIDAIDPIGTMDNRVYDRIGCILKEAEKYEPYLTGEMIEDIGVFFNLRGKFNKYEQDFSNHSCSVNTIKTMIEQHIPVGVIANGTENLTKYKLLFASDLNCVAESDIKRLISYVENGGNLYLSGESDKRLMEELLGASFKEMTRESCTYVAPKKEWEHLFGDFNQVYPLPFSFKLPLMEGLDEADVLAEITLPYTAQDEQKFASIHSNPPGIHTSYPAVALKKYGKGSVIWSAAPIENETIVDYKTILMNLLGLVLPSMQFSVSSNAPKDVEIVTFSGENFKLVSAVRLSETCSASPVLGFEITVKADKPPKFVTLLPGGTKVAFSYKNGSVTFNARTLDIFDMYKISF